MRLIEAYPSLVPCLLCTLGLVYLTATGIMVFLLGGRKHHDASPSPAGTSSRAAAAAAATAINSDSNGSVGGPAESLPLPLCDGAEGPLARTPLLTVHYAMGPAIASNTLLSPEAPDGEQQGVELDGTEGEEHAEEQGGDAEVPHHCRRNDEEGEEGEEEEITVKDDEEALSKVSNDAHCRGSEEEDEEEDLNTRTAISTNLPACMSVCPRDDHHHGMFPSDDHDDDDDGDGDIHALFAPVCIAPTRTANEPIANARRTTIPHGDGALLMMAMKKMGAETPPNDTENGGGLFAAVTSEPPTTTAAAATDPSAACGGGEGARASASLSSPAPHRSPWSFSATTTPTRDNCFCPLNDDEQPNVGHCDEEEDHAMIDRNVRELAHQEEEDHTTTISTSSTTRAGCQEADATTTVGCLARRPNKNNNINANDSGDNDDDDEGHPFRAYSGGGDRSGAGSSSFICYDEEHFEPLLDDDDDEGEEVGRGSVVNDGGRAPPQHDDHHHDRDDDDVMGATITTTTTAQTAMNCTTTSVNEVLVVSQRQSRGRSNNPATSAVGSDDEEENGNGDDVEVGGGMIITGIELENVGHCEEEDRAVIDRHVREREGRVMGVHHTSPIGHSPSPLPTNPSHEDTSLAMHTPTINTVAWALITGASTGMGREYALQLGQKGFNLVIIADPPTQSELEAVKAEILQQNRHKHPHQQQQQQVVTISCDLLDGDVYEQIIFPRLGKDGIAENIAVLVNSVRMGEEGRRADSVVDGRHSDVKKASSFDLKSMTLTIIPMVRMTKYLLPFMKKRQQREADDDGRFGSAIINTASHPPPPATNLSATTSTAEASSTQSYIAAYTANKTFIRQFSDSIRSKVEIGNQTFRNSKISVTVPPTSFGSPSLKTPRHSSSSSAWEDNNNNNHTLLLLNAPLSGSRRDRREEDDEGDRDHHQATMCFSTTAAATTKVALASPTTVLIKEEEEEMEATKMTTAASATIIRSCSQRNSTQKTQNDDIHNNSLGRIKGHRKEDDSLAEVSTDVSAILADVLKQVGRASF